MAEVVSTAIELKHITKSYEQNTQVLSDVSVNIPKGSFVTVLGASGCGKTTLLKLINKLIIPDSGDIFVNGKNINNWNTIELRRSIGYVIQHIGLLPHLTIEKNISYVLSLKGEKKTIQKERAETLIELIGLEKNYLKKYPRELSGGQRQRIGVARSLAADPEIILMDEPFGAVDELSRTTLQDELLNLQQKLHKTILFVTHDISEALKLGSKVILMNDGKIEQYASPDELVFQPKTEFVSNFLGVKGLLAGFQSQPLEKIRECLGQLKIQNK